MKYSVQERMQKPILLLIIASVTHGYFWDLDFQMHSSLRQGSNLNPQSGSYLRDSWRTHVVVPTMEKIALKLRELHRTNLSQDLIFGILVIIIGLVAGLSLFTKRKKFMKPVTDEGIV